MFTKCLRFVVPVAGLTLAVAGSAWATGGCVNSPENPTLVLAALGSAAAGLPWLRARLGSRRKPTASDVKE